eukprot:GFUD01067532.1.p1 GENE.GFUD01067532.1~~GFUD01067532.1.p1  ORF type:complete len:447 (-),score=71.32 GFUD01067532.1:21-1361(-)
MICLVFKKLNILGLFVLSILLVCYLYHIKLLHIPGEEELIPTYEYEELRLRLFRNLENIVDAEEKLFMKSQMEQLVENDNFGKWRQQEADQLTSLVQSALIRLQNPPDCQNAKKLLCHLNKYGCGVGCLVHHTAYCLITALATRRVLVLSDEPTWHYINLAFKQFFKPVSSNCTDFEGPVKKTLQVSPNETATLVERISDWKITHTQPYNPPSLPTFLADRIFRLTREPDAWWIGQFIGYLMRPNENVNQLLMEAQKSIDFSTPVVGVHVRRTDKLIREAKYHSIEEYMVQVELWFRKYEMSHSPVRRKIYLMTDEPKVLQECHEKYPHYKIYDNMTIAKAAPFQLGYTEESLPGIIKEVHLLTLTDFVVCTQSSNVCRMIYELMHFKHGDASGMVHSVDVPWHDHYRRSIMYEPVVEDLAVVNSYATKLLNHVNIRTSERETSFN